MADTGANEVVTSLSQAASRLDGEAGADSASSTSTPHAMTPSGFQAVNSGAVAEKFKSTEPADSQTGPPPKAASVTQKAPQTAQTSSGASQPPNSSLSADASAGNMTEAAATYGTRSRNRTGNARPNYAEDQEMDLDYSASAATTTTKKKAAMDATPAPQNADAVKRAPDLSRIVAGANGASPHANSPGPKESTPAAPTNSKKRKAAAAPVSTQTPPVSNSPAPAATRKPNASSATARETNIMTFSKHKACLNKKGELIADDGTKLCVNDHVYLVCEPPADPYYLCRIMEFLHVRSDDPTSPIDSLRVNWYYRPRDVQRFNNDSRLVYGTMHSDMCPLTSLRGKCEIRHRAEIEDLDAYRKERDSFYFSQIFDRFIHRWYECIPVSQIINVPERVKKTLDERWKYVVVEIGRVKELTSAVKTCKRCAKYCASNDSVDCAICKNSYHMNCVQPPLPKKPSRGFAWACGPCSRASERKLEARNTPTMSGNVTEAEEEEMIEEELPSGASNDTTRAPSPSGDDMIIDNHPATQAEIALAQMWPMRYLGIHCRVEDVLQYDDRAIYPRASSRLGPRHQANVPMWHGRPVELVKPADIKKRFSKGNTTKKEPKVTKETLAAMEADREERAKRPKWVQDEPPGYVARGEDYDNNDPRNTAQLIFKMPDQSEPGWNKSTDDREYQLELFMRRAKNLARGVGVPPFGSNFMDTALQVYTTHKYNTDSSLKVLQKIDRVKDLKEPVLTKNELIKFEEGVRKYGSEHRMIRQHMNSKMPLSNIIRFYYLWKKTPKGREIWGNYGGRKGSKRKFDDDGGAQLAQSVANDADDSAFDHDKASKRGRGFMCKFCSTTHSRQWRKAPGVSAGQLAPDTKTSKEKGKPILLALCLRCANLWRKYAIQWEDIEEIAKKAAQGGGKAWKKRIDEELLREIQAANEAASMAALEPAGTILPTTETGEPPKKKSKLDAPVPPEQVKKKEKPPPPPKEPTPPPPPIIPTPPQWRELPCAVCKDVGDTISCDYCKLTVHAQCFGLSEDEGLKSDGERKWVCEQCTNDRNPTVSTDYSCCLCLTEETLIDLVEPPRVSHKKKTDREREKERMEKELADTMRAEYKAKQQSQHRPVMPREPLKPTVGNNWVHVYCAVWTPEIRFSNAKKFEIAEGFQQIPPARHEAVCKLCKNRDHGNRFREDKGACVSCFQCGGNFHASCAFEAGYTFGFDVTPVKGSRKDQITTATLASETGSISAAIWCKEHTVKTVVHPVNEMVEETGKTALQTYVETFKQADLTLTGTVRKANLAQLTKDKGQLTVQSTAANANRRESGANSIAAAVRRGARNSIASETKLESDEISIQLSDAKEASAERRCAKCNIDVTPKWHPVEEGITITREPTPPKSPPRRLSMTLGELADMDRERRSTGDWQRSSDQPRQNIRFMPPGASGRAWDGMPDRYGSRNAINGEVPHEQAVNGGPGNSMTPDGGVEQRPLPQSDVAGGNATPPTDGDAVRDQQQQYLCHRCFLKRKLDPTPPPPERPAHSPQRYPLQLDWRNQQAEQAPPFDHNAPLRMPQDEPPRQSQPPAQPPPPPPPSHGPPPPANGLGLSYSVPHAPPAPAYPPYGQHPPPNGYYGQPHPPPPHHQGPHGGPPPPHHVYTPPPMHDRQPSYGYGGAPPTSAGPPGPPFAHHGPPPPRPPSMSYGPPTHHMANGVPSPHTSHSMPMPSPSQGPATYGSYGPPGGPRRTESPFSTQLPPLGPERFNQSPSMPRPEFATPGQQPPQPQPQPQPATSTPGPPPAQEQGQGQAQPQQQQQQQQQAARTSPNASQARPDDEVGGTGSGTPAEGQGTPGLNGIGASASPSLRNLLS